MDKKAFARLGAVVFVALAITTTMIDMARQDGRLDAFVVPTHSVTTPDVLDAELLRCSEIGEAGARDPACLKAWAENRRRFLGQATVSPISPSATTPGGAIAKGEHAGRSGSTGHAD
ncbi:putative entry exclusion protein TrbK-alt [Bradyrhizobium sp. Pha-3]|uniref:putative entry exclusion protein TrbK-alt n=1 Tax=Bradyrhizobium sp. Pha-3 TaxID=208375 RepID=UPI0035D3E74A